MAEENYARLRLGVRVAALCGHEVVRNDARGRKPACCVDCAPAPKPKGKPGRKPKDRPPPKPKAAKRCPVCGAEFIGRLTNQVNCSKACERAGRKRKPIAKRCITCGAGFHSVRARKVYCSQSCKLCDWRISNPEKAAELRKQDAERHPASCAYFAGHCRDCGAAHGSRSVWERCPSCARQRTLAAARATSLRLSEAKHRAAGRVVRCSECRAEYCPLYGAKPGTVPLCIVCRDVRKRRERADGRTHHQRAKRAGVPYRYFNVRKVLERDGWTCQLCGISTPEELRGTCEPNAPEFDHCIPIARGGPHVPENGQCLCRSCNAKKADSWCRRSAAAARARGLMLPRHAARP